MEKVRGMKKHEEEDSEEEEEEEEDVEEEEEEDLLPRKHMKELEEQNKIIWVLYKDAQQEQEQNIYQQDPQQQQRQTEQQNHHCQQQQQPWDQPLHHQQQQWDLWQQEYDPLEMQQPMEKGELHLLSDPLALTPDLMFGRTGMARTEEEEEEDEDDFEEDEDMKGLMPPKETTREVEEQNRIIFSLYEDSLQSGGAVAGASAVSSSRLTGTSDHSGPHAIPSFPHPSTHVTTTTYPSSSTPSLAPDCAGSGVAMGPLVQGLVAQETSPHKALQLNLALQQVFRATIAKLEEAVKKNQKVQVEVTEALESTGIWTVKETLQRKEVVMKSGGERYDQRPTLMYSRFCVPYFKDSSGMSAPMNEDGKRKVDDGYLDLYTIRSRPWIMREQLKLQAEVQQEWKKQRVKKAEQNMKDLERQLKALQATKNVDQEIMETIHNNVIKAVTELTAIEKTDPEKIPLPPRYTSLDWEQISAHGFDGQRSAIECQLMWDNLLHPWVNRKAFTEKEDLTIQSLVRMSRGSCSDNDWDAIAKRLGTKRTGYLVMQRWVSFLQPTLYPTKWNVRDTKKLLDTVSLLRKGEHIPWSQVHQHLPGYTREQIYKHWNAVNPARSLGNFSLTEDNVLVKGLYLYGLNFTKVAHFLPGRTLSQVKGKFRRAILPTLTIMPWTKQEDKILLTQGMVPHKLPCKLVWWHLPQRLPTQSRCRSLVLKLWQSLTGEKTSPPPLFPLSTTTNESEIDVIRSLLIKDPFQTVGPLIDKLEKSRKEIIMQPVLQELKEARRELQGNTSDTVAERVQRLVLMRGNSMGGMRRISIPSLVEILHDRFFEPARLCEQDFPATDEIVNSLKLLSEMMMFKPKPKKDGDKEAEDKKEETILRKRKRKEMEEEEEEADISQMTELDHDLWSRLVMICEEEEEKRKGKRSREQDGESNRSSIVDGDKDSGDGVGGGMRDNCAVDGVGDMPLIPCNLTTLGTLHSLLCHIPVLSEMASGDFILQNFSINDLVNMKEARLRSYYEQDPLLVKTKTSKEMLREQERKKMKKKEKEKVNQVGDIEDEEGENERIESGQTAPDTTNATYDCPPLSSTPFATSTPNNKTHRKEPSREESDVSSKAGKSAIIRNTTASSASIGDRRGRGTPKVNMIRDANMESASVSNPGQDKLKIHITSKVYIPRGKKRNVEDSSLPKITTYSKGTRSDTGTSDQDIKIPLITLSTTTTSGSVQTSDQDSKMPFITLPTTTIRGSVQDTIPKEVIATPSTSLGGGNVKETSIDQRVTRDKADELLFHRMLSLLLWPTLMMKGSPTQWQLSEAEQRVNSVGSCKVMEKQEEVEEEDGKETTICAKKPLKRKGSTDHKERTKDMSVKSIGEKLEKMKEIMLEAWAMKQELLLQNKSDGKKNKTTPTPKRKRGRKRKRPEKPEQDTAQPQNSQEEEMQSTSQPPAQSTEVGVEEEEVQSGSMSRTKKMKSVVMCIAQKQYRLKSLNRSFQMKKVWEARRQGKLAPRKNKTKPVDYKPRGTRTRNSGQQKETNENNS